MSSTLPPPRRPRPRGTPTGQCQAKAKTKSWKGLAFTSPAILLLVIFFFVPVILCFVAGVHQRPADLPGTSQVHRARQLPAPLLDPLFWKSLRNTLYFAVVVVPVQSAFALLLALLVNGQGRGKNFFRTVYFVPVVTSIVVVSSCGGSCTRLTAW